MGIARAVGNLFFGLVLAIIVVAGPGVAEAAPKASIVMDLRNGEVLHARSADRRLHPASLTKMMTLYLTFQAVRDGRLRLDQKVRVSRHAARQPASKLYLRAGQRVTIRSLIRATAIKSANDAAMVLAEAVGGSQRAFAKMMTQQAKRLGMNNTAFKNPHGLTQKGHYSTARDMATLGRHLFFDFPKYYNIFKRRSDYAAGKRIWNTNRLLRTYSGADGIKTGYTRAAGYNLVATAHRGKKRILAVQFGASSSTDRARRVAKLLDIGFSRAKRNVQRVRPSGGQRGQVVIAQAPIPVVRPGSGAPTRLAAVTEALGPSSAQAAVPAQAILSRSRLAPVRADRPRRRPGSAAVPVAVPVAVGGLFPLPKPRPDRYAGAPRGGWAAELGPFDSETEALSKLARLSSEETWSRAKVSRALNPASSGSFLIHAYKTSRSEAAVACGESRSVVRGCRIQNMGNERNTR